jgi:hypothetical protein
MHHRVLLFAISFVSFFVEPALAQVTAIAPLAVERKQDRDECIAQAAQQGITKRIRVRNFVHECMAARMTARNTAERKQLFEKWTAQRKEREQRTAKEAACKKQARQQKLHFEKRSRFVKECLAA